VGIYKLFVTKQNSFCGILPIVLLSISNSEQRADSIDIRSVSTYKESVNVSELTHYASLLDRASVPCSLQTSCVLTRLSTACFHSTWLCSALHLCRQHFCCSIYTGLEFVMCVSCLCVSKPVLVDMYWINHPVSVKRDG